MNSNQTVESVPALLGGEPAITGDPPKELFHWPIVTSEDEQAVVDVLRAGSMSGSDVTRQFEKEFAQWIGMKHAIACCNGTAALLASFWAAGVGAGDEIICPGMTYWASCQSALLLGATVNFADIDPNTLCIDPADIEHRIGPKTKAIVVVHYAGHPCDMDPIMDIARKHNVKLIEDVSHAQGSLYKGRMCGTFGEISAMSMMAGKSFAIGEAGMIVTNDQKLFERCCAFGFYERTGAQSDYAAKSSDINDQDLRRFAGLSTGGLKLRINQTCSAMGRVQLKYYDERIAEIQQAMNRFWDLLEDVPGLYAHRPAKDSGSTMGGWYAARGIYKADELDGLSCERFCEAMKAEGVHIRQGANISLHLHPVFHELDLLNQGKPTVLGFGQRDVRQSAGSLPGVENSKHTAYTIPWFKKDLPEWIERYALAFRKVATHAAKLR